MKNFQEHPRLFFTQIAGRGHNSAVIDIPEKSKSHKKFKQNNKSAGMNRIWGEMWITLNNNSHLEDI